MLTVLLPESLQTCLWTMLSSNQASQPPTLPGASLPTCSVELPALTPASCPLTEWAGSSCGPCGKTGDWSRLGDKLAFSSQNIIFLAWIFQVAWFTVQPCTGGLAQARSTPSATHWWAASPVPPKRSPRSHRWPQAEQVKQRLLPQPQGKK